MKKKNYLRKAEKGMLIGTSALLLSGFVGCSDSPTDTIPENVLTKAGYPGQPGLPGDNTPFYPAGITPLIEVNVNSCFALRENQCSFKTILPKGYKGVKVTLYKEPYQSSRRVTSMMMITNHGVLPYPWKQIGNTAQIQPESSRPDPNEQYHPTPKDTLAPGSFPNIERDQEVTIKVSTETSSILYLYVTYLK